MGVELVGTKYSFSPLRSKYALTSSPGQSMESIQVESYSPIAMRLLFGRLHFWSSGFAVASKLAL
jgi:hypothetical protein